MLLRNFHYYGDKILPPVTEQDDDSNTSVPLEEVSEEVTKITTRLFDNIKTILSDDSEVSSYNMSTGNRTPIPLFAMSTNEIVPTVELGPFSGSQPLDLTGKDRQEVTKYYNKGCEAFSTKYDGKSNNILIFLDNV
jgi:hypothetical protein